MDATTTDLSSLQLTSTTAPGIVFASRDELAAHYKSDWHKYNLKRKQAGLSCLLQADFEARLEAAKALQQEKQQQAGTDHLKNKKSGAQKKRHKNKKHGDESVVQVSQAAPYDRIKEEQALRVQLNESQTNQEDDTDLKQEDSVDMEVEEETGPSQEQLQREAAIEIEPCQCLFDKHLSKTVQTNVKRMQRKYGFFVPDIEYLTDLTGLIGYCHEKIKLGHTCLYCQRVFTTWQGCQKHMIQKNHTKLCYEAGIDLEDLSVFYDFTEADTEFLGTRDNNSERLVESQEVDAQEMEQESDEQMNENDDDDEWEDISDDEQMEENPNDEDDDSNEDLDDFEEQVASMGFDVTPLGELVFPDGRIIGHRAFRRYYKQRARRRDDRTAVLAAQKAARERIYQGQVYSLEYGANAGSNSASVKNSNALALQQAGIVPGLAAGRAGKGILVASGGGSWSQFSIYRYRAAIRKQRRGQIQGQQLHNKTNQNMNKMDKKHNRLMNGVSVAHAAR